MAQIGELFYKITGDSKPLKKEINKSEKEVKGLGGKFKDFAKIGVAAFGAVAVAGVAQLTKELINAASDAEETRNKFNVVFRDLRAESEAAAEQLEKGFGLSAKASRELLSDTGDLLTGFGFTQGAALDLSSQVNQLAVDLASFTNFSGGAKGASEALTKALLGERESVKALGISILDADVKAKVLELTQRGLTFETERQAKAYATLELAIAQSGNAIGDFERSSDSYANTTRRAEAAVENLQVALGERLLPAATKVQSIFADLVQATADAISETDKFREAFKEFSATGEVGKSLDELLEQERLIQKNLAETSGLSLIALQDQLTAIRAAIVEERRRINNQRFLSEASRQGIADSEAAIALEQKRGEIQSQIDAEAMASAQARLSEDEKEIQRISDRIDVLSELREASKEYGADYSAIQEELNLLIEDRKELLESLNEAETEQRDTSLEIGQEQLDYWTEYYTALEESENSYYANRMAKRAADQEDQQQKAEDERRLNELKLESATTLFAGLAALTALGADQSLGLFNLNKGLASAEAAINSYLAFTKALATYPPPFGAIAAAGVLATGLAQQVKILGTKPPKFADGGIVPQMPGVPSVGDKTIAAVNPGELILNEAQQRSIANKLSGGTRKLIIEMQPKGLIKPVQTLIDNQEIIVR